MNNSERAYLAGIIDGEGTVTLSRHHKNEMSSPHVSVANNNRKMLEWIRSRVGGVITNKRKNKPHHHASYVWSVCFNRALVVLQEVSEFLIVKKPHAELILKEYKKATHRAGKYSESMLKKKERLVGKIRKLNYRQI
jgi:hypothetical protein